MVVSKVCHLVRTLALAADRWPVKSVEASVLAAGFIALLAGVLTTPAVSREPILRAVHSFLLLFARCYVGES